MSDVFTWTGSALRLDKGFKVFGVLDLEKAWEAGLLTVDQTRVAAPLALCMEFIRKPAGLRALDDLRSRCVRVSQDAGCSQALLSEIYDTLKHEVTRSTGKSDHGYTSRVSKKAKSALNLVLTVRETQLVSFN